MCNIPNLATEGDLLIEDFRKVVKDEIFKEVNSAGINGGEPSLVSNLEEYVLALINGLQNLKNLIFQISQRASIL